MLLHAAAVQQAVGGKAAQVFQGPYSGPPSSHRPRWRGGLPGMRPTPAAIISAGPAR
ncbi:MAG: hypothetical protein HC875_40815, partial [Anaerolineales bacterium]|nr:hypothetical protein [Anaerolineales bacterium]